MNHLNFPTTNPLYYAGEGVGNVSARDTNLRGFYREEHDIPGEPRPDQGGTRRSFARQCERCKQRIRDQLDRWSTDRYSVHEPWEWWGQAV